MESAEWRGMESGVMIGEWPGELVLYADHVSHVCIRVRGLLSGSIMMQSRKSKQQSQTLCDD